MNLCRTGVSHLASLLTALLIPSLAFAQVLHTFNNGEVADAEKVNENFEALSNRIQSIDGSGGRPVISITTDPVITQANHPFAASITSDTPLYRVGVTQVYKDGQSEFLSRTLATTPTSYVIDDRLERLGLGQTYDLAVHAQNIDGKATVETVTVGSTLAIPVGQYIVDPPLVIPDSSGDVPLNCFWEKTISQVYVFGEFIKLDNGIGPCNNGLPYNSLPRPVPLVDVADAVGCVGGSPIFNLNDLETYAAFLGGTTSGSDRYETWYEVTTVYTPGNPALLSETVVEWCQYLPSGESSPAGVETFSRTYQVNATKSD
jgi:hypothetical protein